VASAAPAPCTSATTTALRAASYVGGILVDFERGIEFGWVDVRKRVTDWDFPAAARGLRLPDDEGDLLGACTVKLLDGEHEA
jgi:hypothetical protein